MQLEYLLNQLGRPFQAREGYFRPWSMIGLDYFVTGSCIA